MAESTDVLLDIGTEAVPTEKASRSALSFASTSDLCGGVGMSAEEGLVVGFRSTGRGRLGPAGLPGFSRSKYSATAAKSSASSTEGRLWPSWWTGVVGPLYGEGVSEK